MTMPHNRLKLLLQSNWKAVGALGASVTLGVVTSGCKKPEEGGASAQSESSVHLDNLQSAPSNLQRDFMCPTSARSLEADVAGRRLTYQKATSPTPAMSWNALSPILDSIAPSSELKMTVILVRRMHGVPHYLQLSNGTQDHTFQTWSSSKHMAFAALASTLRARSNGAVGLNSWVSDPNGGRVHVGDLVTEATSYEFSCFDRRYCKGTRHVPHLSSNNVSIWAKNLAGRQYAHNLVTQFLGRNRERFDGGYDRNMTGSGWGSTFTDANGRQTTLSRSAVPAGAANSLSTRTIAEFLKRMVMTREDPTTAIPHVTWEDMTTIFYGAPQGTSKYFPHYKVGGMLGGAGDYIQNAVSGGNLTQLENSTMGQWRSFTKVGWGPGSAGGSDMAWHGYGCIPRFDPNTLKATPAGKEFIISAFLKHKPGVSVEARDALLARATKTVILKIMDGTLDRTPPESAPLEPALPIPTARPAAALTPAAAPATLAPGVPSPAPTAPVNSVPPTGVPTGSPPTGVTPTQPPSQAPCNPFVSFC